MNGPHGIRRLGAAVVIVAIVAGLGACSRKDHVLNPPVTGAVTWTNTVHHLLSDRSDGTAPTGCTSCHHAGTGIPDWSDYHTVDSLRFDIHARLDSTGGGNMRQFLKPGEATVVLQWIDAGSPQ